MSPTLTNVLAAAETLSAAERRELIEVLIAGLEEAPPAEPAGAMPPLSDAWLQEIVRRSAEYDAGRAGTVGWEEIQARWRSRRAAAG